MIPRAFHGGGEWMALLALLSVAFCSCAPSSKRFHVHPDSPSGYREGRSSDSDPKLLEGWPEDGERAGGYDRDLPFENDSGGGQRPFEDRPVIQDNETTGLASYYGDEFQGRTTASGEIYDKSKLTAAHRTLPFGTRVRVTNLQNGSSVIVRINDRGPFREGRIIDVSRAAAQALGMLRSGVVSVKLEVLD